jgi:hypothetical protein
MKHLRIQKQMILLELHQIITLYLLKLSINQIIEAFLNLYLLMYFCN